METLTIKEFIDRCHPDTGLTPTAILYLIHKDLIDADKRGRQWFIKLTERTLAYTPNAAYKKNRKSNKNLTTILD